MASELTDWVATKGSYFVNAPYRIHDELVALANYASALALPDQRVDESVLKTGLLDRWTVERERKIQKISRYLNDIEKELTA